MTSLCARCDASATTLRTPPPDMSSETAWRWYHNTLRDHGDTAHRGTAAMSRDAAV